MAQLSQEELELRILREDGGLVVVDKPFDLPSTGRQLEDSDSLQYALIQRYGSMTWAVHQLDADTTGVNVFVQQRELVKVWQARLRFPAACKSYLGIIHGNVPDAGMLLDTEIDGRQAVTRIQPLDQTDEAALLRIEIETGRTHQIRIHLQSIGLSLFGEEWYRPTKCTQHPRQALHAQRIQLPDTTLEAPVPADLLSLAGKLGLNIPENH
jgi:23S rRNA pseudouridine1911/1915/1917 synthase